MLNSEYKKSSDFGEGIWINAPSLKVFFILIYLLSEAVACRLLELFLYFFSFNLQH